MTIDKGGFNCENCERFTAGGDLPGDWLRLAHEHQEPDWYQHCLAVFCSTACAMKTIAEWEIESPYKCWPQEAEA